MEKEIAENVAENEVSSPGFVAEKEFAENAPEEFEKKFDKDSAPIITGHTAEEIENEFESNEIENENRVEAALFISGRFLNIEELSNLTQLNPAMLKGILHSLQKKYSIGVIRIVNRNESWKMDVAEGYHYLINRLAAGNTEFTKAEQETLAVIAYKQPIKQSVVIKIRGNKSYDHIKKFRELGLVVAKKDGHTNELSLSEEFYEYFNVHKKGGE
jgi:segregation and condensation protein B